MRAHTPTRQVIRTRLREPAGPDGERKYTGLRQATARIVREEGAGALYGGLGAHLLRVVPNAAIMFLGYEAIVHALAQ
jgi:solute carrier family 25, member 33/36